MALPSLTLRNTKGSALTYTELDNNFTNLSTATTNVTVGSTTTTLALNDTLTLAAGSNITLTANSSSKTITITGSAGLTDIVTDTTPQLGGDLDVQTYAIVSTANQSINITPNGTGDVNLNADTVRVGDAGLAATITTNGAAQLTISTSATNIGSVITLENGANANLFLDANLVTGSAGSVYIRPGDSGFVYIDNQRWPTNAGTAGQILMIGASGYCSWVNSGTVSTTATAAVLGGIKIGTGLSAIGDGTTSVTWATPGAIGSTTPSTGAFTTISSNVTTTSSGVTVTYTPTGPYNQAIALTGKDTQGGVGYFDFMKVTNTTSGATNANKTFRTNSTGQFEIVNSAYTSVILALTDAGALQVGGTTFPTATGTNGQVLTANGSGGSSWTTVSGGSGDTVYTGSTAMTGTLTPNISSGTVHTYTLTGNITMNTVTNIVSGQTISIVLTQDGTGGRTLTNTGWLWAGGYKTLSTVASSVDVITVTYIGTTYYASLARGFV